jgi:GAF domain-containing protein
MKPMSSPVISTKLEAGRLRTLDAYRILDSGTEKTFDDLARLAAIICETPIALITFVDDKRQWFKSNYGLDLKETSREVSFCAHAIHETDLFEIQDASKDSRFAENPLVTGDPKIRFYAGAPLVVSNGQALGTLCVIDSKPKELTDRQAEAMRVLGQSVVTQLELRRALDDLASLQKVVPLCAWCRNIKKADGTWVDLHEFVLSSEIVTHGMCPTCFANN